MFKTLLLAIFPVFLFGQTITGTLTDASTQLPVAYANIGILNKSIGTVSNDKGIFTFTILDKVKSKDTVMI